MSGDNSTGDETPAPAPSANKFILNPYQGDIFPGDFNGSKLYRAAIKGPDTDDKRLTLSIDNGPAILSALRKASRDFVWNKLTIVPTGYDTSGNPTGLVDLLEHPNKVDLNQVQVHAANTWGDMYLSNPHHI